MAGGPPGQQKYESCLPDCMAKVGITDQILRAMVLQSFEKLSIQLLGQELKIGGLDRF